MGSASVPSIKENEDGFLISGDSPIKDPSLLIYLSKEEE